MATTWTVTDTYNSVCDELLEPFSSGAGPGLSLGIFTQAQFLSMFSTVLIDFIGRTGLVYEIFTQQVQYGVAEYLYPMQVATPSQVFVGGIDVEHVAMNDLDNWQRGWSNIYAFPEFWYGDGLAPKTIALSPVPNFTGAGYVIDPNEDPPYGIFGEFTQTPTGYFSGTANVSGTTVSTAAYTATSDLFNTSTWTDYDPAMNIALNGVPYPILSVTSPTQLELATDAGTIFAAAWSINAGSDDNLTIIGPKSLETVTFALADVVPVLPDSLCPYIAYGILAKMFSTDGEARDNQRANYCLARYNEGITAAALVAGTLIRGN